jgi:regulator of Ty1 transposition protein 103
MPEATQTAYRSSTPDIQNKIKRVVEVWRTRSVFEPPIQEAIEARLDEIDKAKGTTKKTLMGNSLFGEGTSSSGMPKELESLGPLQIALSRANLATTGATQTANAEYEKLNDPNAALPSPPVHAARLSALLKSLANAESSVAESIKARKTLIVGLEKILQNNQAALDKEESIYADLSSRKTSTEAKKREVEDSIMRGLSAGNSPGANGSSDNRARPESTAAPEPERPDFEALTPPPVESFTPDASPHQVVNSNLIPPDPALPAPHSDSEETPNVQDILTTISSVSRNRTASHNLNGIAPKKRKTSHPGPETFGLDFGGIDGGMSDLDEDVAELLRQESAKAEIS